MPFNKCQSRPAEARQTTLFEVPPDSLRFQRKKSNHFLANLKFFLNGGLAVRIFLTVVEDLLVSGVGGERVAEMSLSVLAHHELTGEPAEVEPGQ